MNKKIWKIADSFDVGKLCWFSDDLGKTLYYDKLLDVDVDNDNTLLGSFTSENDDDYDYCLINISKEKNIFPTTDVFNEFFEYIFN